MAELKLMKGNEAIAEAAIRAGVDGYFGYPITPQSEILEYLMSEDANKQTGMVVLQAESELAAINMVYGAACTGKKIMTSSSSPGISLMQEGISYIAGAELPCLIVNVVRGGPGLGTIQPSQADYFQSVKGGGHGDYRLIVLAPASVQEMADFVPLGFDLAFKYRIPVLILSDGVIGQMMEKVNLFNTVPRATSFDQSWVLSGKNVNRAKNTITSLDLEAHDMEKHNQDLQAKYKDIEQNEIRYEEILCDDADYIFVSYGASARICQKATQLAREKGLKVGLFRPITLFPFPKKELLAKTKTVKAMLSVEMSAGQMIEDIQLATECRVKVEHFGRYGGVIHSPTEVLEAMEKLIKFQHGNQ
jgi:2-oxoglutarate/2-oxoacid ferredoxin oxidoreductase subunit alpha